MTTNKKSLMRLIALVLAVMLSAVFFFAATAAETDAEESDPTVCPVHGTHEYESYTKKENGKHSAVCIHCNQEMEEDCTYTDETVYPTQTEEGYTIHTCTKCGNIVEDSKTPAEKDREASRPMGDINQNGKVEAADARAVLRAVVSLEPIANEKLPYADLNADGAITAADARLMLRTGVGLDTVIRHDLLGTVVQKSTCDKTGSMTYVCTYCHESHTLTIPTLSHNYELKSYEAATCQKEGFSKYVCANCGQEKTVTQAKTEHTWVAATATTPKHCSVCGTIVKGWTKVDKDWYYFNADGSLTKGETLIYAAVNGDTAYWYINNGKLDLTYRGALEFNGGYWIVTGGKGEEAKTDAELTLYRAFLAVADATTPDMTMEEKLAACFTYAQETYSESRPRTPHYTEVDWPVIYANDMFVDGTGNCFSYAAAFAYMAKAIGYEEVYACTSGGHAWVEIDGLIYDVEWSIHYHEYSYYGITWDTVTDVNYKGAMDKSVDWQYVKI